MKTISQPLLMILLLGLTIQISRAQTKTVDSLRMVLARHPQADTFRVNRLTELGMALSKSVREKGFDSLKISQSAAVLTQALILAKKLNYVYGQAVTLQKKSQLYTFTRGTEKQALALLNQALPLAQQVQGKALQLDILANIGSILLDSSRAESRRYYKRGLTLASTEHLPNRVVQFLYLIGDSYGYDSQYVQGLKLYFQALKLTQQIGNKQLEADLWWTISNSFLKLADYDQALSYALKFQQAALRTHDVQKQQSALFILGNCYRRMGRYSTAIAMYKALLNDSTIASHHQIFILRHLGYSFERIGNLSAAIQYTFQSLALAKKYHINPYPYHHYLVLARVYQKAGRPDSALHYGLKTLRLAQQYEEKESMQDANLILAQLYAERHDYARAYISELRYIDLKDSLLNGEIARRATAIQFNDQMSHQKSQIALLTKDKQLQAQEARRQRQLLYSSLLVLVLVGSLLALVYRNNRQKQRTNALLQEQKAETEKTLHELKNTQTQLIHKEKMASLGELTAGIAHEIQNPLNFVNNFSELSAELVEELEEEQQKPQPDMSLEIELLTDLKDNLSKILHHGNRASSIVKGMLDHARSAGSEIRPIKLNELADEYLRLAYQGWRAKDKNVNCELITTFDPAVGEVAVMPQEVGRVLLNLFSNAFYAVRERQKQNLSAAYQPTVRVETKRVGGGVVLTVGDNGVGMSDAVKAKIFQPFFTTKPTGEGTGLGLSLSYDIITKGHGGSMTVTSQPGEGSQFTLTLPAAPTAG